MWLIVIKYSCLLKHIATIIPRRPSSSWKHQTPSNIKTTTSHQSPPNNPQITSISPRLRPPRASSTAPNPQMGSFPKPQRTITNRKALIIRLTQTQMPTPISRTTINTKQRKPTKCSKLKHTRSCLLERSALSRINRWSNTGAKQQRTITTKRTIWR